MFLKKVVKRMLLHIKNNLDAIFISINCLEYVTIILNYCASIVMFATQKISYNPHPVILCVAYNTCDLNWTLHTSKKLIVGRALARFFCGLVIDLNVSVNAKWINTMKI